MKKQTIYNHWKHKVKYHSKPQHTSLLTMLLNKKVSSNCHHHLGRDEQSFMYLLQYSKITKQEQSYKNNHFFIVFANASNRSLHCARHYRQTLVIAASTRFQLCEQWTRTKSQQWIAFFFGADQRTNPTESKFKFQMFCFWLCFLQNYIFVLKLKWLLGTQTTATGVQHHLSKDILILNGLNRLKTSLAAAI